MGEVQQISNREMFEFFESSLVGLAADTILKYRRTVAELRLFLSIHNLRISEINDTIVADWATSLLGQGLALTTVIRHLNILGSLLGSAAKKNLISPSQAPARIAKALRQNSALPPLLDKKIYLRLVSYLKEDKKNADPRLRVCEDILRYSLLGGAIPLSQLINLRKRDVRRPDAPQLDSYSAEIIRRNETPTRLYVFSLNQSQRTPRQIANEINEIFRPWVQRFGLMQAPGGTTKEEPDADAIAASIWAALAMHAGATPSEALGCLRRSAPLAIPQYCTPATVSEETAAEWRKCVAEMLRRTEPQWYAMQLRRGVKFEELRREISENIKPVPELFYPCETIMRVVRNKKVVQDQPVISRTAFFRATPDAILPMFRKIGDMAWCYRVHNSSLAPYAVIPRAEMKRFQAAVGIFTPDIELHPLGTLTPRPGEQVIVIAAGYQGRTATVEEVTPRADGSVIIRVLLATDQGYEWRLNLAPAQIQPKM